LSAVLIKNVHFVLKTISSYACIINLFMLIFATIHLYVYSHLGWYVDLSQYVEKWCMIYIKGAHS